MAWGGCGVNGHFAFNEPPMEGEECTNEEFINRATRCLSVSLETRTVNAVMNAGNDIDRIPKRCITVGMKEMFMAKKVCICLPRSWNAGTHRKYTEGVVSAKMPVTLFNYHNDAMMYLTPEATLSTKPEIVIYNKK